MIAADDLERLWQTHAADLPPASLPGVSITLMEAYHVQKLLLDRRLAQGEALSGWKIGLTSPAARAALGVDAPVRAPLTAKRRLDDGAVIKAEAFGAQPMIEPELCFTLRESISAIASGGEVKAAIATVAPAFELIDMRADLKANLPLVVADGVLHRAYLFGAPKPFSPAAYNPGRLRMELKCNDVVQAHVTSSDVIDEHIATLCWLAGELAEFGLALEPGQQIITGSFAPPLPIAPGQRWESSFAGLGSVGLSVA